jgi:hypothetical protein
VLFTALIEWASANVAPWIIKRRIKRKREDLHAFPHKC